MKHVLLYRACQIKKAENDFISQNISLLEGIVLNIKISGIDTLFNK
jgi:hypothetical protein